MTDDEIRTLVREVLASRGVAPSPTSASQDPRGAGFGRVTMVPATPSGNPCVIEPTVTCNHCGYCLTLGH
jgi:hypothetical protein